MCYSENENTCAFFYNLDVAYLAAVVDIVCIAGGDRVAAGLENGRIFLLDSTCYPIKCINAQDNFVIADICVNNQLLSLTTFCNNSR